MSYQAPLWDEAPPAQAPPRRRGTAGGRKAREPRSGQDLVAAARGIADDSEESARPIDYDAMRRLHPRQRSALTRAVRQGDVGNLVKVIARTLLEWDQIGCWPDDWSRWQCALNDALPLSQQVDLRALAAAAHRAEAHDRTPRG